MDKNEKEGLFFAFSAYLLWGILPIYWKLLGHVPSGEVLMNRIFWSFVFMVLLLAGTRKLHLFTGSLRKLKEQPKQGLALLLASVLISLNWFLFIWAVNMEKMVETSLGYYMNPLVSVILGIVVLKEKLVAAQVWSFLLALAGVGIMTASYGQFPWIAFGLAFSFGFYGLVKKMVKVDSSVGLALETLAIMPVALLYMAALFFKKDSSLFSGSAVTDIKLMASGVITAIPLLFFAKGVKLLPLNMMGFMQYIAPTLMLILGVFLYHEPFSAEQLLAFAFIWTALAVYTLSAFRKKRRHALDDAALRAEESH